MSAISSFLTPPFLPTSFLLVLFLVSGLGCSQDDRWQEALTYELVRENVFDKPPRTQVDQWIAVSGKLTQENLHAFLSARYDSIMTRGDYAANEQPTNVYIYLFASKTAAERGGAEWLAMLERRPGNAVSIRMNEQKVRSSRN